MHVKHSTAVNYLLNDLQAMLADGVLRGTGFLALLYTVVFYGRNRRSHAAAMDGIVDDICDGRIDPARGAKCLASSRF